MRRIALVAVLALGLVLGCARLDKLTSLTVSVTVSPTLHLDGIGREGVGGDVRVGVSGGKK